MQSHYFQINHHQLHFRCAGTGPPLILFHASPSSSRMFIPLIEALSAHFFVFAPDTPGYGQSSPLGIAKPGMEDYANFFHQVFEKTGWEKVALYGTATGAQLAIRYALQYPEQISQLYLDNAADFTDEQRKAI